MTSVSNRNSFFIFTIYKMHIVVNVSLLVKNFFAVVVDVIAYWAPTCGINYRQILTRHFLE